MAKKRRTFLKETGVIMAALPVVHSIPSYKRIIGANDRIRVGVVGLNGRGGFLTTVALDQPGFSVAALCDVDSRALAKQEAKVREAQGVAPKTYRDFREMIANDEVDAVIIATADHAHAPFAVYALQAGKHVYVEKPSCYCPAEGEILHRMSKQTSLKMQVGNQQRSSQITQEAIGMIHSRAIGDVYEARTWYTNQRGTIGNGVEASPPEWLDWDLWQGPAPRRPFHDNYVHYNWHWFRHWGTGEICNNAEHEVDIALWALQVGFPNAVESTGGRFHYTDDDWQFYDTQLVTFSYDSGKRIIWDGRSCTNLQPYGRGRGTIVYGTNGSMLMDRNGYVQFDLKGDRVAERKEAVQSNGTNITGEDILTVLHFENWHQAITQSTDLNAPVSKANYSNLMCHFGNMSQDLGRKLGIDPVTGHVLDAEAMKSWSREYEPGWEIG